MTALSIRRVADDDYVEMAAGMSSHGRPTTAEEARARSVDWERRRGGRAYVVLEAGRVVGTAGISPSRHLDGAVSVGAQYFDGTRDTGLYRVVLEEARKSGASVVTCTVVPGDEGERVVWEQLGARFEEGRQGRLHPVLTLGSA